MASYFTSSTRSGRSGVKDRSLPALQRLWVPGTRSGLAIAHSCHSPQGCSLDLALQRPSSSSSSARRFSVKRRRDADVLELAVGVEAEEHRAEQGPLGRGGLVQPVARQHHVGGADVLGLQHRPCVLLVRRPHRLGDDAVEPGALELLEPLCASCGVRRRAGQVRQGPSARSRARSRAGRGAPRRVGRPATRRRWPAGRRRRSVAGVFSASMVIRDSAGWIRSWRVSNSRRGPIETNSSPSSDAPLRQLLPDRRHHLGEVARQRLGVARGQLHLVAVAEDQASEAVPLGLEGEPAVEPRRDRGCP